MEQPQEARQAELSKTYNFICKCEACINGYPLPNKLRRVNKSFVLPSFGHFESSRALMTELKQNFKFIEDNIQHHPCFEISAYVIRNRELIKVLGERAAYP